jgi:DNA-directed RNA polymerase specialized sigma54-like protein
MAIELRQQLKLTQQLIMTPQLQMAIKLLQLSRLELMDAIRQELEENPAGGGAGTLSPTTAERGQRAAPAEEPEPTQPKRSPSMKNPRRYRLEQLHRRVQLPGRVALRNRGPRGAQIRSLHCPERIPERSSAYGSC